MDGTETKTKQHRCCRHQRRINIFLAFFILLLGCALTFSMFQSSQKFSEIQEQITTLKQVRSLQKKSVTSEPNTTNLRSALFCSLTGIKRLIFVTFIYRVPRKTMTWLSLQRLTPEERKERFYHPVL